MIELACRFLPYFRECPLSYCFFYCRRIMIRSHISDFYLYYFSVSLSLTRPWPSILQTNKICSDFRPSAHTVLTSFKLNNYARLSITVQFISSAHTTVILMPVFGTLRAKTLFTNVIAKNITPTFFLVYSDIVI